MADELSIIEKMRLAPLEQRQAFLDWLAEDPHRLKTIKHNWGLHSRPSQRIPKGMGDEYAVWLLRAGRGFGKTRTGAEAVRELVDSGRARHIGIIGADPAEIRKTMLEGESGILSCYPEDDPNRPTYIAGKKQVFWPNGAVGYLFSGEVPEKPRGAQFDMMWCDELAAWKYPKQVWDMAMYCLRLDGPKGDPPFAIVTTTPKPTALIRELSNDKATFLTLGSSYDNMSNLSAAYKRILSRYEGTRLGDQEIYGMLKDQDEDALWKYELIDQYRVLPTQVPPLVKVVVSIDPMASKKGAEKRKVWKPESGIVVMGLGEDEHVYLLRDLSFTSSPREWAEKAIQAYHDYEANLIVLETNQGGDMAEEAITMRDSSIKIRRIHAKDGKWTRAEPISLMSEKGMVHHVGSFRGLEDQLCNWTGKIGEPSPDRLDAFVHGATYLFNQLTGYGDHDGDLEIETGRRGSKWAI